MTDETNRIWIDHLLSEGLLTHSEALTLLRESHTEGRIAGYIQDYFRSVNDAQTYK